MDCVFIPVRQTLTDPYLGTYTTYGIRAVSADNPGNELAFVSDVDLELDFVTTLAKRFTDMGLDPDCLLDAVRVAIDVDRAAPV